MHRTYLPTSRLFFLFLLIIQTKSWASENVTPRSDVTSYVIVRSEDSSNSKELNRLHPGEHLPYLGSTKGWYKVELADGTTGFVFKRWTEIHEKEDAGFASKKFTVHFIDVGIGDAAIIDMGDKEIVIDGGNFKNDLYQYNEEHNLIDGDIELLIVTHGDQDHWRGLPKLLGFEDETDSPKTVGEFWEPGYNRDCNGDGSSGRASYLAFINNVKHSVASDHFKRPLENFYTPFDVSKKLKSFFIPSLPEVKFTLLHSSSNPGEDDCSYSVNDASIVVMIEIDGIKMLFTGDANGKERKDSAENSPVYTEGTILAAATGADKNLLKVDLLKAPHHGSETANTNAFIDAVDPTFVIFSASTNHHLPKDTVVERYENNYRVILRTDLNIERMRDHIICGFTDDDFNCLYAVDTK